MFEGSDLSMAYGSYEPQAPIQPTQPKQPPPQQPPRMAPLQQPNDVAYQPPDAMYSTVQQQPIYKYKEESFFDRFIERRFDVLKVISFALIIVLAISFDRVFTFYVTQYVTETVLTTTQEFMLRLSYPATILLVIWLIKAL